MKSRCCPITAALTAVLAAGAWGCPPPQAARDNDSGRDSDGAVAAAQQSDNSGRGEPSDEGSGKAIFPEPVHDFGDVEQGKAVSHLFKVKNGGDDVLHIENVRGS